MTRPSRLFAVWLAGDLTNQNTKSVIFLPDKQMWFSWKEALNPQTQFELQMRTLELDKTR